jgi:hypothetical protein
LLGGAGEMMSRAHVASWQILLQKSARGSLAAKMRNNRIGMNGFLNQHCALASDLELMLLAQTRKIFLQQYHSTGYIEARNVAIEYRWADGDFDLLRVQANDLVRRNVTLIVATGGLVVARVAKDATHTIPLIFIGGG